ncbi:hypothetical protein GCM10010112_65410 [Actinoplanes lobatus]|uniref:Uncharacterized protein n=1 Tax=Actinoplanes lobatus TaxID=113568 RepID=A0ABQ4ATL1_9ACTN|nr:hypothetical protein GCM10010112_65410 [Actinoplanes lobatus]GIE44290.1 hypothetical protein Alo02nite_71880 [Actinoplanes lobatus]
MDQVLKGAVGGLGRESRFEHDDEAFEDSSEPGIVVRHASGECPAQMGGIRQIRRIVDAAERRQRPIVVHTAEHHVHLGRDAVGIEPAQHHPQTDHHGDVVRPAGRLLMGPAPVKGQNRDSGVHQVGRIAFPGFVPEPFGDREGLRAQHTAGIAGLPPGSPLVEVVDQVGLRHPSIVHRSPVPVQ